MVETGFSSFDTMVDKANRLLKDVEEAFEWPKERRKQSYAALRAVLHPLRDRLPVETAVQFGAQLPTIVRGIYYDGWKPAETPVKMSNEEFFSRVRSEFPLCGRGRQREAGAHRTEISGAPCERRRMAAPQIPGAELVCRSPAVTRAEEVMSAAQRAEQACGGPASQHLDRFQADAMAAGCEAVYLRLATTAPKPPAASAGKQGTVAAKDLPPVA